MLDYRKNEIGTGVMKQRDERLEETQLEHTRTAFRFQRGQDEAVRVTVRP